jgi:hypothetical protein
VVVHPVQERLEVEQPIHQTELVQARTKAGRLLKGFADRGWVVETIDDQLDNHHAILDREPLAGQAQVLENVRDHAVRPAVDVVAGLDRREGLHDRDVEAGERPPRQEHEVKGVVYPDVAAVDRGEGLVVGLPRAEQPERMERHISDPDVALLEHVAAEGFQHRLVRPVPGLDLLDRLLPPRVVTLWPPRQIAAGDDGRGPVRLGVRPGRRGPVRVAGRASGGGCHSQSNLASSPATVAPDAVAVGEQPRISRKCPGPARRTAPD